MLRSLLATLGVIIGVAAVISAMSILEGATRDVMDRFESLGSELVSVYGGQARVRGRAMTVQTLTVDDADTIATECTTVAVAAPEVVDPLASVKNGGRNYEATVIGTTECYAELNNYHVAEEGGRFLSREDRQGSGSQVIVLGYKVAKELFGEMDPLNQTVRLATSRGSPKGFRVIGVMEKSGNIGFRNVDQQVMVPITTLMRRMLGLRYVSSISIKAQNSESVEACMSEVKRILRQQHGIRIGDEDDFQIYSQEQQLQQVRDVTHLFAVVFYSIAGISLVVGGIGIMNIMLVSVTERTREIGVRIAVGAQRWDILRQFLIEAGVISLLGGVFGLLVGFGFASALERWAQDVLETHTPPEVIAWALGMAILTGIISGLYPAYKASRLDPVESLRYE